MRAVFLLVLASSAVGQRMPGDGVISSDTEVRDVTFSSDGASIAGTGADGKVRIWDAGSGALRRTVAWDKGDTGVTLISRSDLLASIGSKGGVKLWDLNTGEPKGSMAGPPGMMRRVAFSKDRKFIAGSRHTSNTGSEETVLLWDATGKERFAVPAGVGGTSAIGVSPDGGILVAASYDTNVRAWSARNGELLRLIEEIPVSTFAMAFSPDSKVLATAGADRIVYLWDTKTWKMVRKLEGQPEMIQSMDFSADGRMLLTGGFSDLTTKHPVSILLWDIPSGSIKRTIPAPQQVQSVAFSPDGKRVAAAYSQKSVSLWAVPVN